jgi:hypothetical protein
MADGDALLAAAARLAHDGAACRDGERLGEIVKLCSQDFLRVSKIKSFGTGHL